MKSSSNNYLYIPTSISYSIGQCVCVCVTFHCNLNLFIYLSLHSEIIGFPYGRLHYYFDFPNFELQLWKHYFFQHLFISLHAFHQPNWYSAVNLFIDRDYFCLLRLRKEEAITTGIRHFNLVSHSHEHFLYKCNNFLVCDHISGASIYMFRWWFGSSLHWKYEDYHGWEQNVDIGKWRMHSDGKPLRYSVWGHTPNINTYICLSPISISET